MCARSICVHPVNKPNWQSNHTFFIFYRSSSRCQLFSLAVHSSVTPSSLFLLLAHTHRIKANNNLSTSFKRTRLAVVRHRSVVSSSDNYKERSEGWGDAGHLQVLEGIAHVTGDGWRGLFESSEKVPLMKNERRFRLIFIEGGELSVVDQCFDICTGVHFTTREKARLVQLNIVGEVKFLRPDLQNGEKIGRSGEINVEMFVQSARTEKSWIDQIGTRRRGNHHNIYRGTFIKTGLISIVPYLRDFPLRQAQ